MDKDQLAKIDGLFDETAETETMEPGAALRLVGSLLRKGAAEETSADDAKALAQQAFQVTKCLESWAGSDDAAALGLDDETVSLPAELAKIAKASVEGAGLSTMTITEAAAAIGAKVKKAKDDDDGGDDGDKGDKKPDDKVTKNAGDWSDFGADDGGEGDEDWGSDPAGLRD